MSIRIITRTNKVIGQMYNGRKVVRFAQPNNGSKLSCWIEYEDGKKEDCLMDVVEHLWNEWITTDGAIREDDEKFTVFAYFQANCDHEWKFISYRYGKDKNVRKSFDNMETDELYQLIKMAIKSSIANNMKLPLKLIANPYTIQQGITIGILNECEEISTIELDRHCPKDNFYITRDRS